MTDTEKLEITVNALKAIIKRESDYSKSLLDCQRCASNALIMIGEYNNDRGSKT